MPINWNLSFENRFAELPNSFYTKMSAERVTENPYLIHANPKGAELIGLDSNAFCDPAFVEYFSGNKNLPGAEPLSMVYSGHQFGQWAGQLGDGRALLLGQVRNKLGQLWDIQLKGSGLTPYSRFGDGRAVLRSCVREYLGAEALAGLTIPTTRSLSIIGTGEQVQREILEPGAIYTRLAQSHIRFGHFEHFYSRDQLNEVILLADHVIKEYYPDLLNKPNIYELWFTEIVKRTAELIAQWQAVGFSHGVMNTDNMSIIGLTIDYGPFGFLEVFDPGFICNHSDQTGRYAYDQQPTIGLWNLYALAHALQPLISLEISAEILKQYDPVLTHTYQTIMHHKLGLVDQQEGDRDLWIDLVKLMIEQQADYTLSFRYLADSFTNENKWLSLFHDKKMAAQWLDQYHKRIQLEFISSDDIQARLNAINPKFILRNWVAEMAIRAAEDKHDYTLIGEILNILHSPFDEHFEYEHLAKPAPKDFKHLQVSCSS